MGLRENRRAPEITHVMASVDPQADGDRLVIADIATDGRWLSMPLPQAVTLHEYR